MFSAISAIPLQNPHLIAPLWQFRSAHVHDECPLAAITGHSKSGATTVIHSLFICDSTFGDVARNG